MAGMDLLSDQGFRIDGRRVDELRRISCSLGLFEQADGSAYIEQGNTKVLATIYGPHEVRVGRGLPDRAIINSQFSMASFSTGDRKRRGRADRKTQETSQHLKQTFEAAILTTLYNNSQIDIYTEVIQADGSTFSACVNAATLALMNAGIQMKDFVCSCTVSLLDSTAKEPKVVIDSNYLEQSSGKPELTVATLPKTDEIVFLEMNSRLHQDQLFDVLDTATTACKDVYQIMEQCVRDYLAASRQKQMVEN